MAEFWEGVKTFGSNFVQGPGIAIVRTVAFFVLGVVIIRIVQTITRGATLKTNRLDNSASTFIISIITVILYIILAIVLVRSLGFSTAGIIAAFSAVALAVALALKDSLSSLANGVIIIFTKPFKKGDYVQVGKYDGLVQDIRLFNTKILTYNNEEVVIPNNQVLSSEMINYSSMPIRRVSVDVPIPYGTNVNSIKSLLLNTASKMPNIVNSPAPAVILKEYGSRALTYSVRVWTSFEFYWDTLYGMYEELYNALGKEGISIPFNQLDVHVVPRLSTRRIAIPASKLKKVALKKLAAQKSFKQQTARKTATSKQGEQKK